MSDSQPPFGPPSSPPPPPDQVSYGWSEPSEPSGPSGPQRDSKRKWLLVGGGVVAAGAVVAAAAFGAASLFGGSSKDSSPATALPASTFAYASIDTNPSDGQVGDLLGILAKFPGLTKHLSGAGSGASSDPRQLVFDAIAKSAGGFGSCTLSWNGDMAPWLGTKFAIAGVPVNDKPQPVGVVQVTDTAKASAEISKLQHCDHSDVYVLSGSWLLVAPQLSTIDTVTRGTAAGTLANDANYQHWMGEVGDPGVVQGYVAPSAGALLADSLKTAAGAGMAAATGPGSQMLGGICPGAASAGSSYQAMLRGFGGAAMTMRVKDGGVETETAVNMGTSAASAATGGTDGAQLVTGLPADTSAAIGISVPPNPWESMVRNFTRACGSTSAASQMNSYLSGLTGLSFPGDIDTLLGKGVALSAGTITPSAASQIQNDPTKLPVALQFTGDATGIQQVINKVLAKVSQAAGAPIGSVVGVDASGNRVVVGPSSAYRKEVLGSGGLGADATFKNAVPDAGKASTIVYVNLDKFDSLVQSASATAYNDYFKPLQAVGIAGWADSDHTTHSLLRVTTD